MASDFRLDLSNLEGGVDRLMSRSEAAIQMFAENAALDLQNYMRNNAPWTDRTGHARQRLTATVGRTGTGYRIVLSHGVDYGIWLELANEKRYAIIQPTIQVKSNDVMKAFDRLLERMG